MPGPEEQQSPPTLDFVPELMYPKFMPQRMRYSGRGAATYVLLPTTADSPGLYTNLPPLPASPPSSVLHASPPASPIRPLRYRAATIWLRAETSSISHPLPLPTSSPPLQGNQIGGRREDYGFVGTMDTKIRRREPRRSAMGLEMFGLDRFPRGMGDTPRGSLYDRSKIMVFRSVVMGQQAVISQLQAADRRSQAVTSEMLQGDQQEAGRVADYRSFVRTPDRSSLDSWVPFGGPALAQLLGGGRLSYALSWKPCQRYSLNLPDHRYNIYTVKRSYRTKDGDGDALFQLKSDSLPHAHAQTTKTFYKHQDSRIMKAQELKTKTSVQTLIYKIFLQRYQVYQGRLLASFQDDAKYEHVGQDTRSQGGKDDQDGRIKI
ncbi:hypothetical protein Tco_1165278 [Tanacetum coccineum]